MTPLPESAARRYGMVFEATVFDEIAAEYDRHSPAYPDELIDQACRMAGLGTGDAVLDVRHGTSMLNGGVITADCLLLIPDLVHHHLCGARTSERTNATTTQCFDPRAGAWAADIAERIGFAPQLLPEIVEPGTAIGAYEGATVVAVGTHTRRCKGCRRMVLDIEEVGGLQVGVALLVAGVDRIDRDLRRHCGSAVVRDHNCPTELREMTSDLAHHQMAH